MEWIDVNDRLPENRTETLIYVPENGITICEFKHGLFMLDMYNSAAPTHWQPLPPPPNNHL